MISRKFNFDFEFSFGFGFKPSWRFSLQNYFLSFRFFWPRKRRKSLKNRKIDIFFKKGGKDQQKNDVGVGVGVGGNLPIFFPKSWQSGPMWVKVDG